MFCSTVRVNIQANNQRMTARTAPKSECKTCQHEELDVIGAEKPSAEKEAIIRSMVRQAPDCEVVCDVVEALSAYPQEALERVRDFGTKLEVYDEERGDEFPNYMESLAVDGVVGSYNSAANVLGIEDDNLSPFVLLHEFAHALDASMGDVSEGPKWKSAHKMGYSSGRVIRDYARLSSAEFLAENASAYLVADEALWDLVDKGLEEELAINGMSEHDYMRTHQNYSKSRVESVDPHAYQLVEEFFDSVDELPALTPKPAMDEAQFADFLAKRAS